MKKIIFIFTVFAILLIISTCFSQVAIYPPAYYVPLDNGTTIIGNIDGYFPIICLGYPQSPMEVLSFLIYDGLYDDRIIELAAPQLFLDELGDIHSEYHLWCWENIWGYDKYIIEYRKYPFTTWEEPWYMEKDRYFYSLGFPGYRILWGEGDFDNTPFDYYWDEVMGKEYKIELRRL